MKANLYIIWFILISGSNETTVDLQKECNLTSEQLTICRKAESELRFTLQAYFLSRSLLQLFSSFTLRACFLSGALLPLFITSTVQVYFLSRALLQLFSSFTLQAYFVNGALLPLFITSILQV